MPRRVSRLLIPRRGSLCIIDIIDELGDYQRAASAHIDPAAETLLRHWEDRSPSGDPAIGPGRVLRTGISERIDLTDDRSSAASGSDAAVSTSVEASWKGTAVASGRRPRAEVAARSFRFDFHTRLRRLLAQSNHHRHDNRARARALAHKVVICHALMRKMLLEWYRAARRI